MIRRTSRLQHRSECTASSLLDLCQPNLRRSARPVSRAALAESTTTREKSMAPCAEALQCGPVQPRSQPRLGPGAGATVGGGLGHFQGRRRQVSQVLPVVKT
ncbi:hypothetical protein Krad_2505 [Kineococcus radiotolerans SRS30216 = ATCC BAA-149]|uniref:Uncharacterized protein n=1 Tax=Kineococcus radiotolerans (strain ATCC BAA-149 / DSM 14245 / SRS30216) TaxID=266940 RepID=A6WAZ1_KINRD|nr:hypothetical protein Krad_2505 [Kineococcus radiotolerans SRS30216 = ATCC BAA-149]